MRKKKGEKGGRLAQACGGRQDMRKQVVVDMGGSEEGKETKFWVERAARW